MKGPNSDPRGGTVVAQSSRLCLAVVPPRHSLREATGGGTTSLGDGTAQHVLPGGSTAQCSVSVKLTLAVVPPNPRKLEMRYF